MTNEGLTLRGVFAPLTTPFAADGSVDSKALAGNVGKYNRTGVTGYVVMGSTGESVLLSETEWCLAWGAVREAAASGKTLIAGTGEEATGETIALTRRAAELGYQAALVRTPSYYKPQMSDAALERHFCEVAEASPIPVLIYAVPQFTGLPVTAGLVEKLAAHPNILGIKESSGVMTLLADILRRTGPDFQVLVGSATTFFPSLALGAWGGVLAVACVLPDLCVDLCEAAASGDHDRARRLQQRLHEPTVTVTSRFGIAGLKYAMDCNGFAGGLPRPPLLPLDESGRAEIDRVLQAAKAETVTIPEATASD